ncbi:hypothetical protein [Paenibacillus protaetiae]|uniref:Type IV secretion system protein VirB6 n=1 Tax=Paenibacillus protaetiae TaxID=2509456 RepID=A0A4P6ET44_9BACL|nr:hypothetical protein [Paenibacillus protaetiae]QAY66114.1 hypothetical protein ET464_06615 [Paenibacillus protaetiae]
MLLKRFLALLMLLCFLLPFSHTAAANAAAPATMRPVQVFDVKAEKVVKSVPNDQQFQHFVTEWMNSVTRFAPQLQVDDSCSYVYRIPLEKPITAQLNDITIHSEDVFLFYCEDKPPMLLVFDDKRRPYLLLFKADIKPFIRKVGIPEL